VDNEPEGQGTSILEREAKLRGEAPLVPQIITGRETVVATPDEDEPDDDEDEIDNPTVPVQAPQTPDPGVFTPGDYTFEVVVYDAEGKSPKIHKIKSVDDWDELLERDPNLGSASALLKAQRAVSKMENSQEREQREFDAKKAKYNAEKAEIDQRQQATDTMVAEIGYLQGKGDLPEVAKKYVDADWSDPEVAKQPGVKEQLALLNYMKKENKARIAAKLKPMTSILDAFNAYQIDRARKGQPAVRAQAAAQRKAQGARVAAVSPAPASGGAPAGISVGRGGSLRDLGRQGF
jgi:hypothetical protein